MSYLLLEDGSGRLLLEDASGALLLEGDAIALVSYVEPTLVEVVPDDASIGDVDPTAVIILD